MRNSAALRFAGNKMAYHDSRQGEVSIFKISRYALMALLCLLLFQSNIYGLDRGGYEKEAMTSPTETLAESNEDFSFRLYSQLIKEGKEENIVVSPLSISIALSIAYNGASGDTKKSIAEVLGLNGIGPLDINRAYGSLLTALKDVDPKVKMSIANSLWAKKDARFRKDFIQTIQKYYGAEGTNVNFHSPDATRRINKWVNKKSRGKISRIVDESLADAVLLIINTLYFKGAWHKEFRKDMTREDTFTFIDGSQKKVKMMFQEGEYDYLSNQEFQAISLPYGSKAISMYIFLPGEKSSLKEFHRSLEQKRWKEWIPRFRKRHGRIGLPRFKQGYGRDLSGILSSMGMHPAFEPGRADFEGIFQDSRGIFISRIKHKTFIEVNEKGTEAAAVTSIEAKEEERPTEEPFAMIVNRPFFFAIRDNETGILLFTGSIVDPLR